MDFAEKATGKPVDKPVPPMFTPYKLRGMTLQNRVVVSPMSTYSAKNGLITDFHFVHYGARAMGGAALMYTEMTDVSADARITPGCAGIYTDEQEAAWKRVVDYVHDYSDCKIAIQLGHAGRKGSTKVGWEGYDMPLDKDNWELIAPTALKWDKGNQTPREMGSEDFVRVRDDFVAATKRSEAAGFDMIELHAGHGYLLSSFITPVSNHRTDDYGGSLENRLRFPLEVFKAMRDVWPVDKPMSVRISSTDWVGDKGVTPEEAVLIAKAFADAGADIIDVSTGQTLPMDQVTPVFGRMFQTPMSDRIRNEAAVATMAVGNIYETDHVNSILAAGRADLVLLARPHLMDPNWTIRSAAELEYHGDAVTVPKQYITAYTQLETNLKRAAEMAVNA
ncbi:MAG: anthraniloyl-CoA monooxygenase [Alphaproteobacteria bacterium]|nr:MAG: anthraniloyl-CoA monooxygenase [Alphaproteobacteria bacterium]